LNVELETCPFNEFSSSKRNSRRTTVNGQFTFEAKPFVAGTARISRHPSDILQAEQQDPHGI
jgi:hypothetical protein